MTDRSRDGVGRSGPSPDAEPEAIVDRPDRVTRRLDDPRGMGRTAAGMRNLVAHHYDKVQDRFVWDALGVDIPGLLDRLDLA